MQFYRRVGGGNVLVDHHVRAAVQDQTPTIQPERFVANVPDSVNERFQLRKIDDRIKALRHFAASQTAYHTVAEGFPRC